MVQSLNVSGILNAFRVFRNPSLIIPHLVVDGTGYCALWSFLWYKYNEYWLCTTDIRQIDFVKLKEQGVKVMAFDKDNCLTAPYQNNVSAEFEVNNIYFT
jgi:phosphatidylglycerophosphatase GEP4